MLKLDHLTVIAPSLNEGVEHVKDCLGLDVPFGTRHHYMGTHNHRLQLGAQVYLEIVALDPDGTAPGRPRWFGLDDQESVRADWEAGRRLRGWVASTADITAQTTAHGEIFGPAVALPPEDPAFDFTIPADGSLPLGGAAPSLIGHRGRPTSMAHIPDLGAQLKHVTLEHPEPDAIRALFEDLAIDRPPEVIPGPTLRYSALIETPAGERELT
ncbi:MAG: VOC family protein [Pseudomonadota bacterium]